MTKMNINNCNNGLLKPYEMTDDDKKAISYGETVALDLPFSRGILMLDPKGFLFTHQSGGFACNHPQERGFPWIGGHQLDCALAEVCSFIYDEFQGYCVPSDHFFVTDGGNYYAGPITNRDANKMNAIFASYGLDDLKVDRSKLDKSMEAWIYGVYGDDEKPCVFVTYNSD